MDVRRMRIGAGVIAALVVGVLLLLVGQPWFLAVAIALIAGDVIWALLIRIQTGAWGPLRLAAGLVTFAVVAYLGIVGFGDFGTGADVDPNTFINAKAANAWALILTVAMVAGAVVTLGLELIQTGRLDSLASQFTTRTYLLMAVGIAVNIILGQAVASALKIPIYLDSIGTILVGVLCGPIAGALTGGLGNILWSYVIPPPFQYQPAAAFAITAVAIGVIAGLAGRAGFMRPRPNRPTAELLVGGVDHRATGGRDGGRGDHRLPGGVRDRCDPGAHHRGPGLVLRPAGLAGAGAGRRRRGGPFRAAAGAA